MRRLLLLLFLAGLPFPLEAQRLPRHVQPERYQIHLHPNLQSRELAGSEKITIRTEMPTKSILLNDVGLVVSDIEFESGQKSWKGVPRMKQNQEIVELIFQKEIPPGRGELRFKFHGKVRNDLKGLYLVKADGRSYAVTQFEGTYARMMFPCFDEPEYKAVYELSVTLEKSDTAISNSGIQSDEPEQNSKLHTIHFAPSPKMSTYLVALAIGKFQCVSGSSDGIPIRVCTALGKQDLGAFALKAAEHFLHFYNDWYGIPYPFTKLDMVAIPDYEWGGMENTASIFYRESALLIQEKEASVMTKRRVASIVAHEIAHQWFGDLVTMRWWDDIWLNEGFATWMTFKALQTWDKKWDQTVEKATAAAEILRVDSLQNTRAIRAKAETPDEIKEMFDGITYEKAGAVLRMLENYTGEEAFRTAVQIYLKQNANGNATAEGFWNVVASVSGKPADRILASFVDQPGVPLLIATQTCESETGKLGIQQQRFFADEEKMKLPSEELWNVPVCIRSLKSGKQDCRLLENREQIFSLESCDPVLMNSQATGFYRSAYSSLAVDSLAVESLTPSEEISLLNDQWALLGIGRTNIESYLRFTEKLRNSDNRAVIQLAMNNLTRIKRIMVTKETEAAYNAWLREWIQPIVSSIGLQAVREESDDRKALRGKCLEFLGIAKDPSAKKIADTIVDSYKKNPESVESSLIEPALCIVASDGKEAIFHDFENRAMNARSPEEYLRYLSAMTCFQDPATVQLAIDFAKSPYTPGQELPRFFEELLQGSNRNLAWNFLKHNWKDWKTKVVSFGGRGAIEGLGASCDEIMLNDVHHFFQRNPAPGAERTVQRAMEDIRNCIQFQKSQDSSFRRWLHQENK